MLKLQGNLLAQPYIDSYKVKPFKRIVYDHDLFPFQLSFHSFFSIEMTLEWL